MNASYTLNGWYLDGLTPMATPASLTLGNKNAELQTENFEKTFPIAALKVSPRIGSAERFIQLENAGQYQCEDSPVLDQLVQEVPSEGLVAWLESRIAIAVVGALVLIASLCLGYVYGIPFLAGLVIERVPLQVEWKLGEAILDMMDKQGWLKPSQIPYKEQSQIDTAFIDVLDGEEVESYIQVEFRESSIFGANAFALPGGLVVVTDELVNLVSEPMEVVAVLAHEAGHVHYRHGMQSLLQKSLIGLAVATVTADINTTSSLVVSYPAMILENGYSRDFEYAADSYAAKVLERDGHSPTILANALEKIEQQRHRNHTAFSLFSTHPQTGDRVQRLVGEGQR